MVTHHVDPDLRRTRRSAGRPTADHRPLHPRVVIAGHKNPDAADDASQIAETRRYLTDARDLLTTAGGAQEFYEAMLSRYPDRINPGALWGAALTLFPRD